MHFKKVSKIANQKFMVAETYMALKSCGCCNYKIMVFSRVKRLQETLKGLLNDLERRLCLSPV